MSRFVTQAEDATTGTPTIGQVYAFYTDDFWFICSKESEIISYSKADECADDFCVYENVDPYLTLGEWLDSQSLPDDGLTWREWGTFNEAVTMSVKFNF